MEFQKTKAELGYYRCEHENYECTSLSPQIYEDPLQTVPDAECFDMAHSSHHFYGEQAVPDPCFYQMQLSPQCETTPVKLEGTLFTNKRKVTPLALNFEDESSDSSVRSDPVSPCKSTQRRKKNRRSYLSNDLPVEVRNQRRTVANARERARVGRMANGYEALQKALPKYLTGNKMRKVDILNSAVCHIQTLMRLLSETSSSISVNTTQLQQGLGFWDMPTQVSQCDTTPSGFDYYATIPNLAVDGCSLL